MTHLLTIETRHFSRFSGLRQVSAAHPNLFDPNTASKQFRKDDGSWDNDDMTVITNLESAEAAMNVIVEQGEGSLGVGHDGTPLEESHYQFFKSLYEEFDGGKSPFETYSLIEEPNAENFVGQKIHSVRTIRYFLLQVFSPHCEGHDRL